MCSSEGRGGAFLSGRMCVLHSGCGHKVIFASCISFTFSSIKIKTVNNTFVLMSQYSFFLNIWFQGFRNVWNLLTKPDRAVRQCFASLIQGAVAAISNPSSHSVWLACCAKTPLSCAFVGHLLCSDKDWTVSHFTSFWANYTSPLYSFGN